MRIIAFIIDAVFDILTRIGQPAAPPRLMPAGARPLCEMQGATLGEDEPQAQSAPEYEPDQGVAWWVPRACRRTNAKLEATRAATARRERTRARGCPPGRDSEVFSGVPGVQKRR